MELLVVITIIAIIAALLMPAISSSRRTADNAKCASNLRQLGVAIASYASEHSGMLPGPCPAGVGSSLVTSQKSQLIYFLQPYLQLPLPTATAYHPEILHCPAADAVAAAQGKRWYDLTIFDAYSNNDLPANKKYLTDTVFGSSNVTPVVLPLRLATLSAAINQSVTDSGGNPGNLSMIPAIREVDGTLKSWPWPVAPTPFHGDHENALFLDWHVGPLNPADFKVK